MEQSVEAARKLIADIVLTSEPREVIQKTLEMPFNIGVEQYEMWKLTYALKWQTDSYNTAFYEPLKLALTNAFEKLKYVDPKAEVELILMFLDGAATAFLLHEPDNKTDILQAVKTKYQL